MSVYLFISVFTKRSCCYFNSETYRKCKEFPDKPSNMKTSWAVQKRGGKASLLLQVQLNSISKY